MTEQEESDLMILSLTSTCIELRDENTKLRRLACKLYHCQKHVDCRDCPFDADPSCMFSNELRDLGIEVD